MLHEREGGTRRTGAYGAVAAGILVALLLSASARIAGAYEHRKSTPSVGVQVGFGRLVAGETISIPAWPYPTGPARPREFNLSDVHSEWGPSAHLGVRFVLDRNHALGFGFDDLRYRRGGSYTTEQKSLLARWVKFTTFHADYYLYFNRRSRVSSYFAPFAGFQQRELRIRGSEIETGEYRFLYGASLGVEYFVRRSFSIDIAGRVFGMYRGGGTNVAVQPAIGVHIYVI